MILGIVLIIFWTFIGFVNIFNAAAIQKDYKVDLFSYILIWALFMFAIIVKTIKEI